MFPRTKLRTGGDSVTPLVVLACVVAGGCVSMAAPPPPVTLGSPTTAPAGGSEIGLGAGSGVSLFPGAHAGGEGWFARWRYGLTERLDLGVDVIGAVHGDKGTLTTKLGARQRVGAHWRLEAGLGAADDSDGKSLGGDLAATVGSTRDWTPWNYYAAFRLSAAHGYPGDVLGSGDTAPPDMCLGLAAIGASARLAPNARFVFEGAYGALLVRGAGTVGQALYLAVALLFDVGGGPAVR